MATKQDEPDSGARTTRSLFTPGAFKGANVIILSLDTTTTAVTAAEVMPDLQRVLTEGVTLQHHSCAGAWTSPCMSSFVLGSSAVDASELALSIDQTVGTTVFPDSAPTLAEAFQAAGYSTYLLNENEVYGERTNTDQGFDVNETSKVLTRSGKSFVGHVHEMEAPFFAQYHSLGGHAPYVSLEEPAEYYASCTDGQPELPAGLNLAVQSFPDDVTELWPTWTPAEQANVLFQMRCAYTAKAKWQNDLVYRDVWDWLDELGLLDNTLVLTFADHGEDLGEHLDPSAGQPGIGHNVSTYGETVDTFAGFWAQDLDPTTWSGLTDHGDLAPTLLTATGIPVPETMLGVPVGEADPTRELLHYKCGGVLGGTASQSFAVTTSDGLRLHWLEDGSYAVFDIFADPLEAEPLSGVDVEELKEELQMLSDRGAREGWCGG